MPSYSFHTVELVYFFWGPLFEFFGLGSGSKAFFEPTNVDYSFGFGNTALSFCFQFGKILGRFCTFWAFRAIFGVGVKFNNFFGTYLHTLTTLILEV